MSTVWSGTISCGLLQVPVKLQKATDEGTKVEFREISRATGSRVKHHRVDSSTGQVLTYDDIVKGYEVETDTYVTLEADEIEQVTAEATKTIEITHFVDESTIPLMHFDAPYYLTPDELGTKTYRLLQQACAKSSRVAIGRIVMRTRQRLIALRAEGDHLTGYTMRWADQIRDPKPIEHAEISDTELDMAIQLIETFDHDLDLSQLHDNYNEQLLALIHAKREGKQLVHAAQPQDPEHDPGAQLLEVLARSIEQVKQQEAM